MKYLIEKKIKIKEKSTNTKTIKEALDYLGFSNESQINILRLKFPSGQHAEFIIRQLVMKDAIK